MSLASLVLMASIAASSPNMGAVTEYLVEQGDQRVSSCKQMGTTHTVSFSDVVVGDKEYEKLVFEYKVLDDKGVVAVRGMEDRGMKITVVYDERNIGGTFDGVANGAWHKSLTASEAIPYGLRYLTQPCKLAKEVEGELVSPTSGDQEFFRQSLLYLGGKISGE